jgi:hypothetical protein
VTKRGATKSHVAHSQRWPRSGHGRLGGVSGTAVGVGGAEIFVLAGSGAAGSRFGGWCTQSGGGKRIWRLGAQRRWIKLRPRGLDSFWSRRVEGAHLPELRHRTTCLRSACPPPPSTTA